MLHLDELLARVVARPHDTEAALVYADALMEASDPHGELIALQVHEMGSDRERAARRALEGQLGIDGATTWRDGFVRRTSVDRRDHELEHPAFRLLRSLRIDPAERDEVRRLAALSLPHLRHLDITVGRFPSAAADLDRLFERLSAIDELALASEWLGPVELPDLTRLPALRSLVLEHAAWPGWQLPDLERLMFETFSDEIPVLASLESVLAGRDCPSLRALGVFSHDEPAEVAAALATSSIADRLEAVGLVLGLGAPVGAIEQHRELFGRVSFLEPLYDLELELEAQAALLAGVLERPADAIETLERGIARSREPGVTERMRETLEVLRSRGPFSSG